MKLSGLFVVAMMAAIPAFALAAEGPANPEDFSATAVPSASTDSTSLACYFQKGSDITWKWGLTSDSKWYALPGNWQKTAYTKIEKFFSTASMNDITQACGYSSTYYGLVGYSLLGAFAAQKSAGYNYPILVNGNTELWPQF